MRIDPIMRQSILQSYRSNRTAPQEKTKAVSGSDQVSFSDQAVSFSKLFSEIKEQMETRSPEERSRIADIADRIGRGEYQVAGEKVAEKILADLI